MRKKSPNDREPKTPPALWDHIRCHATKEIYLPPGIFAALKQGTEQNSVDFGRRVSYQEFIARAICDRVGKMYGQKYANRLYRQNFNGILVVIPPKGNLPPLNDPVKNAVKAERKAVLELIDDFETEHGQELADRLRTAIQERDGKTK